MTVRAVAVLTTALAFLSAAAGQEIVAGPDGDCGFSRFHPRQMAHYIEGGALHKAVPQYPLAAKARGLTGKVRVRVLVNKQGLVEETCPEYARAAPRPDRSLVVAGEAAALQWTFPPNFGIQPIGGVRFDYVEGVLVFDFTLKEKAE